MLIKLLSLTAVFCVTSCGDKIADAVVENLQNSTSDTAKSVEKADTPADQTTTAEVVFKSGDGTENNAVNPVVDWIIVDKSDRNLVLYQDGKEIKRYNNIRFGDVPVGHKQFQGDEKTPEGVYEIDGRNPGSSFHLSLRISYPNKQDKAYAAARGKSPGGDIFIHGQPNGYKGPPIASDWTDGCIALSDKEIREIYNLVPDGAKILIQQ